MLTVKSLTLKRQTRDKWQERVHDGFQSLWIKSRNPAEAADCQIEALSSSPSPLPSPFPSSLHPPASLCLGSWPLPFDLSLPKLLACNQWPRTTGCSFTHCSKCSSADTLCPLQLTWAQGYRDPEKRLDKLIWG